MPAVPLLQVGAESALGYVPQPVLGTPVVVPATAGNWAQQLANNVEFTNSRHLIKVGGGVRGSMRKAARGQSHGLGGFEVLLQVDECTNLIAYFLGKDTLTTATHVMTVAEPRLLTLEDQKGGMSYQYSDVKLDQMDLTSSANDWKIKYTLLSGPGGLALATQTVPTFGPSEEPLQFGDISAITLPGGLTPDTCDAFSLSLKNMLGQWFGGGKYTPTRIKSKDFEVTGKLSLLFDTAAAATAYSSFVAGTESALSIVIGHDATHQHTIALANCNFTKYPHRYALNDFVKLDVDFTVRDPMNALTWTVANSNTLTAY